MQQCVLYGILTNSQLSACHMCLMWKQVDDLTSPTCGHELPRLFLGTSLSRTSDVSSKNAPFISGLSRVPACSRCALRQSRMLCRYGSVLTSKPALIIFCASRMIAASPPARFNHHPSFPCSWHSMTWCLSSKLTFVPGAQLGNLRPCV